MDQQKKHRPGTVSKNKLLEDLNVLDCFNLALISFVD